VDAGSDVSNTPVTIQQGQLLLWPSGRVKIPPANFAYLRKESTGKSGTRGEGEASIEVSKKRPSGGELQDLNRSFKKFCRSHGITNACLVAETAKGGR
jgi:hypothetical protein